MLLNKHYIALRGDVDYAVVAVHTNAPGFIIYKPSRHSVY